MDFDLICKYMDCSSKIKPKHKGICPDGHIPSEAEWTTLMAAVGGTGTNNAAGAGKKLKANSSLWSTNTGTDDYGFAALPGGSGILVGNDWGRFNDNTYSNWWGSTSGEEDAYVRNIGYDHDNANWGSISKANLQSVRYVKD